MILGSIVSRWRRMKRKAAGYICSKWIFNCKGMSDFHDIPLFTNHRNIEIGEKTQVFRGVTLNAGSKGRIRIGKNCILRAGAVLRSHRGIISISDDSSVNEYMLVSSEGDINIGRHVRMGSHTVIVSGRHTFSSKTVPIAEQGVTGKGIIIEDDVWLGSHVCILDGVRIGKGSIIGAGSVVTKDIPDYSIAVGVPASVIRERE